MACAGSSPEEIIAHLSWQPQQILGSSDMTRNILDGMIRISEPAKWSAITRSGPTSSSLGILDKLPLEAMHLTLEKLDFQSLSRVSRVSLAGQAIVHSLPAYRDSMAHAPETLAALGQTGLVSHHAASLLHAALLSKSCISCGQYGPFLFLPTCERCCYVCLHHNQSLWVIPLALAARCFGLTPRQVQANLPIMRSIPGVYWVGGSVVSRRRLLRLTSVKAVKELAIEIHGMLEVAIRLQALLARSLVQGDTKEHHTFRFLHNAPLRPLGQEPFLLPAPLNDGPFDNYCGMASIPFPSLTPNNNKERVLDHGLWCRGCKLLYVGYRWGHLGDHRVRGLIPAGRSDFTVLQGLSHRARSRDDFLDHVKGCYGAQVMAQVLGPEEPQQQQQGPT